MFNQGIVIIEYQLILHYTTQLLLTKHRTVVFNGGSYRLTTPLLNFVERSLEILTLGLLFSHTFLRLSNLLVIPSLLRGQVL